MTRLIKSAAFLMLALSCACLPSTPGDTKGGQTITVYGFSIMKEALEKDIYPAFSAKWKREHGVDINFVSSFAGSETVTNQILQGAPADVAILSIERDAERLVQGKASTTDWHTFPNAGIVNKTPFIILVRKGNPKNIKDFADLAAPGIKIIHPDPVSSGGAQWSILAMYGAELKRTEASSGESDQVAALHLLQNTWKNVISTPGSAREARTQFETGFGDALITYELEGLLMKQAGAEIDVVIPKATIFSEHPAVIVDRNVTAAERPVVQAFLNYLWTDEAQKAFVKYHFRSVTNEAFNDANTEFAKIEQPFTIQLFGGWSKAYPDIIEKVFRDQVQNK
ncbi:MAG TPA: sulfate ABC transporter substrate-binding protein [Pyrinomonadaceae bacterium]|nr:sulfate ABC transporter substrate-binding protein [Pyrinomonadaceae bacterium]